MKKISIIYNIHFIYMNIQNKLLKYLYVNQRINSVNLISLSHQYFNITSKRNNMKRNSYH